MKPVYERGGITVYHGDNRRVLPRLSARHFSAVVTDPPYGLEFMGRDWDRGVPGPHFWALAREAALPGAHLLSFGGTRTWHRIGCAIEDAGWELRDTLMWLYGSGFPKGLDVSKSIDATILRGGSNTRRLKQTNDLDREGEGRERRSTQSNGIMGEDHGGRVIRDTPATDAARDWQGWNTALKPAWEPIILARNPSPASAAETVLACGTGALNIDACRIGTGDDRSSGGPSGMRANGKSYGGFPTHADDGFERQSGGRYPPNVLLDPEAAARLDRQSGERASPGNYRRSANATNNVYGIDAGTKRAGDIQPGYGDTGGASRFFPVLPIDDPEAARFLYCPKASRAERNRGLDGLPERCAQSTSWSGDSMPERRDTRPGRTNQHRPMPRAQNHHPTVKPLALMRWLLTLVTPPGGTVLDLFAGSGTTGAACAALGIPAVLIEREAEYIPIITGRVDHALDSREERA